MDMATHPERSKGRQALLVVGMHRSGTSAVALALSRSGWALGRDLLGEQAEVNRDGFGENAAVVRFNEALLSRFGRNWYQLLMLPGEWLASPEAESLVDEAATLLEQQFGDAQTFLMKDPRLCLTLPIWRRALEQVGVRCRVILQWRHPESVARSLLQRDRIPHDAACLLWAHYMLAAESASRDMERAPLRYEDVLREGATALRLFPDLATVADAESVIDPELGHHRADSFSESTAVTILCERILAALENLEHEESLRKLDGIVMELSASPLGAEPLAFVNSLLRAVVTQAGETVQIGEDHRHALSVIAAKDKEIEEASRYADQCEQTIAEKDGEVSQAIRYAEECAAAVRSKESEIDEIRRYAEACEAAVQGKDAEITEIRRYAEECETAVQGKDAEITEVSDYAQQCEHNLRQRDHELEACDRERQELQAHLDDTRTQFWYRLLRRLGLLR
jgi:hypothetical protein